MQKMTEGSAVKRILLFALPIIGGRLFQLLYNFTDSIILGRTLGMHALAAVGCTTGIVTLILGCALGITNGIGIVIAQNYGAGDQAGVRRSYSAGLVICVSAGLLFSLIAVPLSRVLLVWMNTPAEILEDAQAYISVLLGGVAITMLYNVLAAALRALGDSRSPLIFLIISALANIALDYLFILAFHMGTAGAAYATLLSQALAGGLCLIYIARKYALLRLLRFGREDVKKLLGLGLPMGFQSSVVEIGNILLQSAINGLGAVAVGAVAAALRIRQLNMLPLFGIGSAVATFTAQNAGAKKEERIVAGMKQTGLVMLLISAAMALINIFAGRLLVSLFIVDSPEAAELAYSMSIYLGTSLVFLAGMLLFRNVLQGMGQKLYPMISGILELAMSVLAALVIVPRFGFTGVSLANPLAWIVSGIPLYIAFFRKYRKGKRGDL